MKINSLKYKDGFEGWELSQLDFFDLTLLVGVSGVGKTQILTAIRNIRKIVGGESLNGIEWSISFENDGKDYNWSGEFEKLENNEVFYNDRQKERIKPKLIKELITLNGETITERNKQEIIFAGIKMPKLSSEESIISIFKEEDKVRSAYNGFVDIVFRDHTRRIELLRLLRFASDRVESKYQTLKEIRNSNLSTADKLSCLYENQKEEFDRIIESYKDVFQQIEDVKIELSSNRETSDFAETSIIQFKEKGVEKWIVEGKMSSGMLRAFIHISEMHLLAEGTVVLIDEFENSLGVNCIDVLTEDLIFENHNLQFIATSHHPYIINKIPYDYWKIVTRNRGKITAFNAKDFDLGESHHERFMNLINLPKFKEGIEHI